MASCPKHTLLKAWENTKNFGWQVKWPRRLQLITWSAQWAIEVWKQISANVYVHRPTTYNTVRGSEILNTRISCYQPCIHRQQHYSTACKKATHLLPLLLEKILRQPSMPATYIMAKRVRRTIMPILQSQKLLLLAQYSTPSYRVLHSHTSASPHTSFLACNNNDSLWCLSVISCPRHKTLISSSSYLNQTK